MAFLGRVARHRPSLLLNHAADAAPLGGIRSFATHSSRASPLLRASATDTSTGALLHHPPAGATPASLRRAHATVAGAAASPASLRRAHATVAGAAASPAPLRRSHATVAGAAASPAPLPRAHATVAGSAASPAPLRRAHATVAGAAASPAPLRRAYATVAGAAASPAPLRRAYDTLAGAAASPAPLRRAYNTLAGATPYSAPLRRVTVPGALLRHHAGPGALLRRAPSFSTKTVFITEEAASLIEKEMARMEAKSVARYQVTAESIDRLSEAVRDFAGNTSAQNLATSSKLGKVSIIVCSLVLFGAVTLGLVGMELIHFGGDSKAKASVNAHIDAEIEKAVKKLEMDADEYLMMKDEHKKAIFAANFEAMNAKSAELDAEEKRLDEKERSLLAREEELKRRGP